MTPVRDAFMTLLAAALGNAHAPVPELTADQWRELFALAAEHKVLPLIFEPAYPLVARLVPALAAGTKRQVRQQVIVQTIRTAEFLELYRALEEAKRRAGRVLWLNPIPQGHWPHIRSVQVFSTLCTMVPCSTLGSLAAACRKLTM